ncbi:MAG: hypothetical protein AAGK78_15195, partial [Planctomycetota bacterium]
FAQEIDQTWISHLQSMLARLGDGDRIEQTANVSRRVYHVFSVWRRIERFSARLDPSFYGFRRAVENDKPAGLAFSVWFTYALIVFLGYNIWIFTIAGGGGAAAQEFGDLRLAFGVMIVAALPLLISVALRLRENAIAVADRLERALLDEGGLRRRARYADLDPYPLVIERHRSALDDLKHLIT